MPHDDSYVDVAPVPRACWLQVYVQPTGMVGLCGLEATSIFLKGALDKLKVLAACWPLATALKLWCYSQACGPPITSAGVTLATADATHLTFHTPA